MKLKITLMVDADEEMGYCVPEDVKEMIYDMLEDTGFHVFVQSMEEIK